MNSKKINRRAQKKKRKQEKHYLKRAFIVRKNIYRILDKFFLAESLLDLIHYWDITAFPNVFLLGVVVLFIWDIICKYANIRPTENFFPQ